MSRGIKSLKTQVSRYGPTQKVGQETSKDVEKDESGEEGSDGNHAVGFGNVDLSFELVESWRKEGVVSEGERRKGEGGVPGYLESW